MVHECGILQACRERTDTSKIAEKYEFVRGPKIALLVPSILPRDAWRKEINDGLEYRTLFTRIQPGTEYARKIWFLDKHTAVVIR